MGDPVTHRAISFLCHLLLEVVPDGSERVSVIVSGEVLYVLEEEHLRSMMLGDLVDLEEEGAARVLEALLLAGDTEGLAGEASAQNVMCRDTVYGFVRLGELGDITEGYLAKVHEVGTSCILVPFTRENARTHDVLSGHTETSDACEEVDERECRRRLLFEGWLQFGEWSRGLAFTGFRDKISLKETGAVGFVG